MSPPHDAPAGPAGPAGKVYWGKYRGTVNNPIDPMGMGRVEVNVPNVYASGSYRWALPCLPFTGSGTGMFCVPPKGAWVWVEFENGDAERPIWSGGFWGTVAEIPGQVGALPTPQLAIKMTNGSSILIDDTPKTGTVTITASGGDTVQLGPNGIKLQTAAGHVLSLDSSGITIQSSGKEKIVIASGQIQIDNAKGANVTLDSAKVTVNKNMLEVG